MQTFLSLSLDFSFKNCYVYYQEYHSQRSILMFFQFIYFFLIFCTYLFFYYAAGTIASEFLPSQTHSILRTVILGFFLYYFLFSLIAIPMKITLQPLKLLSITWSVILLIITGAFIFLNRKQRRTKAKLWHSAFKGKNKYTTFLLVCLIAAQAVFYSFNDETYAIWDQSYYLGDTASSLYTNTISQYDPYTGRMLKYLNTEYLLETYQNHSSVMCQLLGVHPMIENLTIMSAIVITLYYFIIFEMGQSLFSKNREKSIIFTAFVSLLNYFSFNLFTAAEFLIIRSSEGKTILASIIIPALLYFFLETAKNPEDKTNWYCSFLTILGSFGLNMSSIFMIPFEISAFYIPLALRRKSMSAAVRYLVLMLPCLVAIGLYLLTKNIFIYTRK